MDRRKFIASGMALAGTSAWSQRGYGRNSSRLYLPEFDSSDLKLIAGVRPFRSSGLCIEGHPEKVASKTVFKNYGHGGAGWTLSWGSASVMADKIADTFGSYRPKISIFGAGVIGLTTAYELVRRGYSIRVLSDQWSHFLNSEDVSEEPGALLTSDVAGGQWAPSYVNNGRSPRLLKEVISRSFFRFNNIDRSSGKLFKKNDLRYLPENHFPITYMPNFFFNASENKYSLSLNKKIPTELKKYIQPQRLNELPFHVNSAWLRREKPIMSYESFIINVPVYLKSLFHQLQSWGVEFNQIEKQSHLEDLVGQSRDDVAVCCLGLGSKKLFHDNEVIPVRGQLILMTGSAQQKNSHVNYAQAGAGYMFPREDAIILGGTYDRGLIDVNLSRMSYKPIYDKHMSAFS